jgi:hypothetical protein
VAGALGSLAPHAAGLVTLLRGVPLEALRPALLRACAALLPGMTPSEAARCRPCTPLVTQTVTVCCDISLAPDTPGTPGLSLQTLCTV